MVHSSESVTRMTGYFEVELRPTYDWIIKVPSESIAEFQRRGREPIQKPEPTKKIESQLPSAK